MQSHQLQTPAWMDPGRPGFLLSLLEGIFNAGLDMLLDSSRTWAEMLSPTRATNWCLSQGRSSTVVLALVVALWTALGVGCRQLDPGSAFCLVPASSQLGSPGAACALGAVSCLVTSVLEFRPKQTWPLKLFLIQSCPLLCPLWLQERTRSEGGGILNTSSQAARL